MSLHKVQQLVRSANVIVRSARNKKRRSIKQYWRAVHGRCLYATHCRMDLVLCISYIHIRIQPLSPVRAAVVEQFVTATVVDRQTSPSQTSVHDVSVSLQRTTTRSAATDWTHDRAGAATDPQPNTVTKSQRRHQQYTTYLFSKSFPP